MRPTIIEIPARKARSQRSCRRPLAGRGDTRSIGDDRYGRVSPSAGGSVYGGAAAQTGDEIFIEGDQANHAHLVITAAQGRSEHGTRQQQARQRYPRCAGTQRLARRMVGRGIHHASHLGAAGPPPFAHAFRCAFRSGTSGRAVRGERLGGWPAGLFSGGRRADAAGCGRGHSCLFSLTIEVESLDAAGRQRISAFSNTRSARA